MGDGKRYVMVGGTRVEVSEEEWRVASLPRNTPVEWSGCTAAATMSATAPPPAGSGVLLYSWFYDGIIAEVDCGGKRVTLCPEWDGSKIRALTDTSRLNQPMTYGDGI